MSFIKFASCFETSDLQNIVDLVNASVVLLWVPYCIYTSHPIDKPKGLIWVSIASLMAYPSQSVRFHQKVFNIPVRPQIQWSNWNLKWFPHWTLCMSNPNCHPYLHPLAFAEIKLAKNVEWTLPESVQWQEIDTTWMWSPGTFTQYTASHCHLHEVLFAKKRI